MGEEMKRQTLKTLNWFHVYLFTAVFYPHKSSAVSKDSWK